MVNSIYDEIVWNSSC